jgi:sodium-dependent phosphate cotransporter
MAGGTETPSRRWLKVLYLLIVLYVFLASIELISGTFKLFGKGFAETLVTTTDNPFTGLLIGLLATSLVQSSSTVTSLIVGLVASGSVGIEGAVPMVMGANIGTSVTNSIVALGHMNRPQEFRRAFAGATVHDFFNVMAVAVFLPLEILTGFLHRTASWSMGLLMGQEGLSFRSPLKAIVKPVVKHVEHFLTDLISMKVVAGLVLLFLGIAMLILSLRYLVQLMRSLMMGKVEVLLDRYLFGKPLAGILVGTVITILVQSSSVTTSLTVPMLAAGIVTVENIFPFVLGANVGTTITALLASMVTGSAPALTVALCHVFFNIFGIVLLYPLRRIPIGAAFWLGGLAVRSRFYAIAYVLVIFFVIPVALIFLTR